MREAQKSRIYLLKSCVLILNMFKLQTPSKYSPFHAIHLLRCFVHCSKQFLNSSISMPFSASTVFSFHLFHIGKMFPFENFFSTGETRK